MTADPLPESPRPTLAPEPSPRPRARFRPHERVRQPGDFRRAFEGRRSVSDAALVVYGALNGQAHPRLGLSIGKRKVRRATARNRLKRLLREAFRLSKADLPAGIDLIIVPRGPGLTLAQARQSLVRLSRDLARKLEPRRPRPETPTAATAPEPAPVPRASPVGPAPDPPGAP